MGGSPTEVLNCAAKADRDRPAASASASSVQSFAGASWSTQEHGRRTAPAEILADDRLSGNLGNGFIRYFEF